MRAVLWTPLVTFTQLSVLAFTPAPQVTLQGAHAAACTTNSVEPAVLRTHSDELALTW